ncbi:hypothetical protein ES319_A07G155200v1 [Gossypium barbadense]|uniref:Uncharacterized protein n=1 Tax=Gossypium barbadense TaxID=3634 RepID=A0A5J5V4W4_GOSBA|nr:hypothetical protein ES319_A07G155200v1 [Gossypium barbadense]
MDSALEKTMEMEFNWQPVLGTSIGFCGAAFGSVGGVGGGGIVVPMLSLIVGFDPKSATAISKCLEQVNKEALLELIVVLSKFQSTLTTPDEAEIQATTLCSSWQENLKNPN